MNFEWDPAKDAKTRLERGFGFRQAVAIFAGRVLVKADTRYAYGEERFNATGRVGALHFTVTFTDRSETRRIISARLASRKERAEWRTLYG